MKKLRLIVEDYSGYLKKIIILLILFLLLVIFFLLTDRKEKEDKIDDFSIEELMLEPEMDGEEDVIQVENTEDLKEEKILIDLKGAVQFPGVYEMEANHRVIDCVNKGGGFLEDAEEKSVNLAQRLEDQMVIYIPRIGEEVPSINQINTLSGENISSSGDNQKIDLNIATKEELKSLNGIGDVKAENIINYRETNGFFKTIDDIKNVSGIGDITFEKLKEELTVGP